MIDSICLVLIFFVLVIILAIFYAGVLVGEYREKVKNRKDKYNAPVA